MTDFEAMTNLVRLAIDVKFIICWKLHISKLRFKLYHPEQKMRTISLVESVLSFGPSTNFE